MQIVQDTQRNWSLVSTIVVTITRRQITANKEYKVQQGELRPKPNKIWKLKTVTSLEISTQK